MVESLCPELAVYRHELDKVVEDAQSIAGDLSNEQFVHNSEPGVWSPSECLEHLNTVARVYLGKLPQRIEELRKDERSFGEGAIDRSLLGTFFIWLLEPPYHFKVKAPAEFLPKLGRPKSEVMEEFSQLRRQLGECIERANGLDLRKNKMPLPTIPKLKLSLGEIFAILLAHERRHLWQARRVSGLS